MLVSTKMITGFNTDVPHDGHIYHVQTEDGGKDNPILESLVYIGGTIVAKKLTPYPKPIKENGSQDAALASLLKRQHQVIIAAIKAGRIDELIRHSLKQQAGKDAQAIELLKKPTKVAEDDEPGTKLASTEPEEVLGTGDLKKVPRRTRGVSGLLRKQSSSSDALVPIVPAAHVSSKAARPAERPSSGLKFGAPAGSSRGKTEGLDLDQVLEDYGKRVAGQARLEVKVVSPEVFTAGKNIGLRVQVTHDAKPDFEATVTVKIIGTAFKPQVFIGRVSSNGVASFGLTLPSFSTGTAAIVIEAQSRSGRGELKNLIRRA